MRTSTKASGGRRLCRGAVVDTAVWFMSHADAFIRLRLA